MGKSSIDLEDNIQQVSNISLLQQSTSHHNSHATTLQYSYTVLQIVLLFFWHFMQITYVRIETEHFTHSTLVNKSLENAVSKYQKGFIRNVLAL